jgi:demethylmenaquinone methyltransferase/2-methoxy-6-polyprenyl-1,4-benzoquinol methylase
MFDDIAERYDFLNHFLSAGIDRRWRRQAIRALQLTERDRVLDICTGTAHLAIAARRAQQSGPPIVGVDFAGAMLAVGQKKLRRAGLTRAVRLIRGDATRLPIPDGSVSVVTAAFGIRNVENTIAAFSEIHRVLGPQGRFAILEFATPSAPALKLAYQFYSKHVMPRIGAFFSKHREAYGYLPASIEAFDSPEAVANLLRGAGFASVTAQPLTGGIVFLYAGCKP